MSQILLIDDDPGSLDSYGAILRSVGHIVFTALTGRDGLAIVNEHRIDLVVCDLRLPDISGLDVLQDVRDIQPDVPCVIVTGFGSVRDAVECIRLGAVDFLEKPVFYDDFLRTVDAALTGGLIHIRSTSAADASKSPEPHAAARWARAVIPIIDSPRDPRTIAVWGRVVAASPGALRNWCRTVGLSPRRSLVFARLLRAVWLRREGHKPENLLDVVDRRTLDGLLRLAGFNAHAGLPASVDEYLERQQLINDSAVLGEIKRAIGMRTHHEQSVWKYDRSTATTVS